MWWRWREGSRASGRDHLYQAEALFGFFGARKDAEETIHVRDRRLLVHAADVLCSSLYVPMKLGAHATSFLVVLPRATV